MRIWKGGIVEKSRVQFVGRVLSRSFLDGHSGSFNGKRDDRQFKDKRFLVEVFYLAFDRVISIHSFIGEQTREFLSNLISFY